MATPNPASESLSGPQSQSPSGEGPEMFPGRTALQICILSCFSNPSSGSLKVESEVPLVFCLSQLRGPEELPTPQQQLSYSAAEQDSIQDGTAQG
ncbi:hypothetical protein E2C01_037228 [Portunus trituberculatus]|uniref:Uncharacterized protein n=1 Tax=Portunus trituberculatus TaxID=210409 RepID=A0A5B7FF13_PORTR|nr:hypothetical protein [Portunus trituberculatus]